MSTAQTLMSTRPSGQRFGADGVFGDVGGDAGGLFRPRDPENSSGRKQRAQFVEKMRELDTARDEDVSHFEAGLGPLEKHWLRTTGCDFFSDAGRHLRAPGALVIPDA